LDLPSLLVLPFTHIPKYKVWTEVTESFDNLQLWLDEIDKSASENVKKLLVGNKVDRDGRKVSTERGKEFAAQKALVFGK